MPFDLYFSTSGSTVTKVGSPIAGFSLSDSKFPPFTFPKSSSTQAALDAINALLTSKVTLNWTLGDADGATVPTAAAGVLTQPAGRTWHPFPARVSNITERLTDTGPQITIHFDAGPAHV
jgi:hypothetical protein